MRKLFTVVACAFWCLSASLVYAEDLKLGGGAPPIEKIIEPLRAGFQNDTGISLFAAKYGPQRALKELDAGTIDAAVLFLSPQEAQGLATREKLEVNISAFQQVQVAEDMVVMIVNPANPVSSLSMEQAKGVLTGSVRNWKEVGGADSEVILVWSEMIKGVNEIVGKVIMNGAARKAEAMLANNNDDIRQAVATVPEAVAVTGKAKSEGVKILESPQIKVPVYIYTKGAPSGNVQKLIQYIHDKK